MNSGVYRIVNTINHKVYIGSAVNLRRRELRHWNELSLGKHHNKHLQRAWVKYGCEAFVFEVIATIPVGELADVESKLLKENVGKPHCYNIATDATTPCLGLTKEKSYCWGRKASIATKLKQSLARKGRSLPNPHKANVSKGLKGVPKSEAHKQKLSERKKKNGCVWYGVPKSDTFKERQKDLKGTKTIVVDAANNRCIYKSIKDASRKSGISLPVLKRAIRRGTPITSGRYKDFYVQVV